MATTQATPMSPARICCRCGTLVPACAPQNLCVRCLFDTAAELETDLLDTPTTPGSNRAAKLQTSPSPIFGPYELLGELGRGGQGVVYRARHRDLGRVVALKTIAPAYLSGPRAWERFHLEASAASRLDHPNIVPIYEVGERDGFCFYSMKLVEGATIEQLVAAGLPDAEACGHITSILVKVALAVHHAHQRGVLHRDLKPSNILLDQEHEPHVSDFGLARQTTEDSSLTATHALIGTPAYLAPEVAAGGMRQATVASDIYGLGAILYHLLTGRPPFGGETVAATLRAVQETEPTAPHLLNPSAPRDLETICLKCLQKEPAKRYATAQALAEDLEHFLRDEPIVARPATRLERAWRWCRRKPALATAIVLLFLLVLVLGIGSPIAIYRINQARREAQLGEQQAKTEAAKSEQVARFLEDMLEGVGPSVAKGRDTTMLREILDKTAERVGNELADQPRVEIEVRDVLARTYQDLGLHKQAEAMARENLGLARSHFGAEDIDVAQALKILGKAQLHLGNYTEAEQSTRSALAIYRKLSGNEDADVATCLDNIASALLSQSRLPEAEAMQREALATRRKVLGEEDIQVAVSLGNLAFTLQSAGKLAEAETLSRQGLDLLRKVEGNEHPDVATALNNMGLLLDKEGKYAEEEAIHREALAMRRKLLGNEHPDVAQSLFNLAAALQLQRKLTEAEPLIREALKVQRNRFGAEHPDVAYSLNCLSMLLYSQGKLAEAEATCREALEMRRKLLGGEHVSVATSLNNLANVLRDENKLSEAEARYREAVAMTRRLLGDEHPTVALALANLATVLERQGKLAEADTMARDALALCRKVLGSNHPQTFKTANDLISILVREGKLDEAQALARDQLADMRARLPADDPALAAAMYRLAAPLLKAGKLAEAEPLIRECLAIREKKLPDDWRTFNTRAILGDNLIKQEKYAEAEPLLLSGYEGMNQREANIRGPDRQLLRRAIENLSKLYDATSRPDQAAEWKHKLEDFDRAQTNQSTVSQTSPDPPTEPKR